MSDKSSQQDKTQEPTQKRLQDARKKGQIPRSRELNTMLVTFVGACGLMFTTDIISSSLHKILLLNFQLPISHIMDKNYLVPHFTESSITALLAISPYLALMFVVALFGPMAIGGMSFSMSAMAFKMNRLNPLSGFKRMFGIKGLVELVKAILKVTLIASIVYILLKIFTDEILNLGFENTQDSIAHSYKLILLIFTISSAGLIVVALIDAPYQFWQHKKQLRMTLQEVKDEFKETEGNPENKGRLRNLQRELAQKRMMEGVPDADVIITNPTHFAVALKYDVDKSNAPLVIAKGVDFVAEKIKEIALKHEVSVFCAPALARAVYYSTDINKEIPYGLYISVAKVLAYVFQLKNAKPGKYPDPPEELEIPNEFRVD
ncbi:MAG: flagellar biosynthesis protein FlhB [Gammaproteobacteria bacterium]|nr:flagellar biosynthesis protein FlhB [Gammaproteobacteria bacterium]